MNEKLARELDYVGRLQRQRKVKEIHIDTHEDLDRLTELLLTGLGYAVTRRLLPLGDYQWESRLGLVIVERKTPSDATDLIRLTKQAVLLRMASTEGDCFPIILIDHRQEWWAGEYRPWADHDFDNLLVSIAGRIRIAHCEQGQLAHRLDALYTWSQKASHTLLDIGV